MKKLLSILLAAVMLFGVCAFAVSAENKTAEMNVKSTPNWLYDKELEDKYVFPDYFTVGRQNDVHFSLNGIESLDLWEFDVIYNSDVIEFSKVCFYAVAIPEIVGYVPDKVPSSTAEKIDDGVVHVTVKADKDVKKEYFYVDLEFEIKSSGTPDIKVENISLTDCEAVSYDVILNTDRVPVKCLEKDEIPSVQLDFEKTLSYKYGSSSYMTTELSKPMTVSEFISTVAVSTDECEKIIVNDKGERLDSSDMIPTGARFIVLYNGVSVFATNLVLIGDVNGDAKINAADARTILRYAAKIDTASVDEAALSAANTARSADGITAADAREILRFSAGIGQSYDEWYEYHCRQKKSYPWLINDNL